MSDSRYEFIYTQTSQAFQINCRSSRPFLKGSADPIFLVGRFLLDMDNERNTSDESFSLVEHLQIRGSIMAGAVIFHDYEIFPFVLSSFINFVASIWIRAVRSRNREIFTFQLLLLTAGGIITALLVPWTSAKGLLTRLAKSVSSVWINYLVSIGNTCLCGSCVKLGSFLHRSARPDLIRKDHNMLLCVSINSPTTR